KIPYPAAPQKTGHDHHPLFLEGYAPAALLMPLSLEAAARHDPLFRRDQIGQGLAVQKIRDDRVEFAPERESRAAAPPLALIGGDLQTGGGRQLSFGGSQNISHGVFLRRADQPIAAAFAPHALEKAG